MATADAVLPDDIDELKRLCLTHQGTIAKQKQRLLEFEHEVLWLKDKLYSREKSLFGSSSEKLTDTDSAQYRLFNEAEVESDKAQSKQTEPVTVVKEHTRKNAGRKKRSTPDETQEVVHDLPLEERTCPCCGSERPLIKEDRSEELDLVPAKLVRIVHLRKVYGPCRCEGFETSGEKTIITAPRPAKIVKGSDFSNRSIALCIAAKFADGIPFARVEKILERYGLEMSRATLANLAMSTSLRVSQLVEAFNRDLKRSPVILMDETPVQVHRISGKASTSKSYMWVRYGYRDKRPIVSFVYRSNRSSATPNALLADYTGFLQTDGYAGYSAIGQSPGVVHVGCFAHIRRKFFEAFESAGKHGSAGEMLELLKQLYASEKRLRDKLDSGRLDDETFTATRAVAMAPILEEIHGWLRSKAGAFPPKTLIGQAVSYALGEFPKASRFVDHSLLRPDTNLVENQIRPFVVGRKGWLFMDSPSGATASAAFYSIIATARLNGHEPLRYLTYVFDEIARRGADDPVDDLLPYTLDPQAIHPVKTG